MDLLFLDNKVRLDENRSVAHLNIPETIRLCPFMAPIFADPLKSFRINFRSKSVLACEVGAALYVRTDVLAAVLREPASSEESFKEGPHEREVAADDRDAHFHKGPAAGVYLGVSCICRSEGEES